MMNTSLSTIEYPPDPIVPAQTYEISMLVLLAPLVLMSFLGVVTNALNTAVFLRQGVTSDSTTLSLFALTVSDALGCAFMVPHPVCFYLERFSASEDPLVRNCLVLSTMSATYPHIICTQITCWVTVYIAVERAICVMFPLKARLLIRYKNTLWIMSFIFCAEVACHVPFIVNCPILWVPDPSNNGSAFVAVNYMTPTGATLYRLSNLIESSVLTTAAMGIIALATVVIVTRVRTSSAWREAMTTKTFPAPVGSCMSKTLSASNKKISKKDKEALKVVSSVTTLFLVCLAMSHIPGLAMYVIPEFSLDGRNKDLFQLFYTFKFNLDALNASVNFFFYLKQSSKFHKTYDTLFH